jgi:glycosyltransferase involved in cell wall biosynthesis
MTIVGLFLNKEVRSGGHKRYLELLGGLASSGVRVIAFMNVEQPVRPSGVELIELNLPIQGIVSKSHNFASAVRRGIALLPKGIERVDWIIVFGETHLSSAIVLKRRLDAPILYSHRSNAVREGIISLTEHRYHLLKIPGIILELLKSRHYEHVIAKNADVIVFQSPFDRNDFLSRESSCTTKSTIIRGNIGEPRFKREYADANRSDRLHRVLFIGSFGDRKGAKYLLEAAATLAARGITDVEYDLVGGGPRRPEFEALARDFGIAERVHFYGRIADPFPLIIAADLLIVPSLFDSYPNTVLEALHAGTPVIASATGGIPDMLRHDELLFPARDAKAIADRIERCVVNPEFYAHIRALCAERKKDFLFDWALEFEKVMRSDGMLT